MKFTPENIRKNFPKKSAEVLKTFVECKKYINKYAIAHNLTNKDIIDITDDILNAKRYYKNEHSSNIHKTIAHKLCSLSDYTRPHGEYLFNSLGKILGNDIPSIARSCTYHMLLEYYIPNLSYNNWKAYITN